MKEKSTSCQSFWQNLGAPNQVAKAVLALLLRTHETSLNDESLNTLLIEIEAVVNPGSLIVKTLADSTSEAAIPPSSLLTIKLKIVMSRPGSFGKRNFYSRKRRCRKQHIANEFWCILFEVRKPLHHFSQD